MDIASNIIRKIIEPPIESVTMTLTMTPDEAAWLLKFVGKVSGNWTHPIRMISNTIYENLSGYAEIATLAKNKDGTNVVVRID